MNELEQKPMELYFQEILRQISIQSALISGFAFAGLTMDQGVKMDFAHKSFTILISSTVGLETITLFVSSSLLFALRLDSTPKRKWKPHYELAWWTYLLGLISFLTSLPFLIYIKVPQFYIPAQIAGILVVILVLFQLRRILKKTTSM